MEWYLCCFLVLHLGPFYFNSFEACANSTSNLAIGVDDTYDKKHPRRTDEEWMNLIQECRSSGLSDKCWCEEHHIHTSNFYYQIRRLRKMACEIPEPTHSALTSSHCGIVRGGQESASYALTQTVPGMPL